MGSRAGIEGERRILSARVVRAIQSIKEVVKNYSDADIYVALQETNMDPNETAQKLLNQDPFHEVRRKRDKKKDVRLPQNTGHRGTIEVRKPIERVGQSMKSIPTDQSVPRGGYSRNSSAGGSGEFRVVRHHRINNYVSREVKHSSLQNSTPTSDQKSLQVSEGSTVVNQKSSGENHSPRQASEVKTVSHNVVQKVQQGPKPNDSKPVSAVLASNHSVLGVYSSSSDPVHVPSSDSRSAANVKRELGAVGVRRQTSVASSSAPSNSISIPPLVKDGTSSSEPLKSSTVSSTNDQTSKTSPTESVLPSKLGSRSSSSNQYNSRSHQLAGHQKSSQPAKEWKRKAGPKSNTKGQGVIESSEKSVSHPTDSSQNLEIDTAHVRDEVARVDIYENQNVFIAEHIRVSDSDRSRLTFGSFGTEVNSPRRTAFESLTDRVGENTSTAVSTSLSASIPESPIIESSASKRVDLLEDQILNAGLNSTASGGLSENLLHDKKGTSTPQNLDHYTDIGMVRDNSPTFTHTESQQQQNPTESASFSVYNPQSGYDIPYFRASMDDPVRGQGLQASQEVVGSHMTNIPVSSISMVQQQQQPMPQMYQQVHVSPFPNIMPYRQYISPVYVPPMPMTGYSANPNYPHPSSSNNFVLMPGANNLKYGIQQFKPVPSGSPTGFGNFATPTGYAINAPGVVGSANGLEDSSRLKYKDANLYAPNAQTEPSEVWVQNPREFPNMQSASYYNMTGQTSHGAYMPPHPGHTSYNTAAAQSSHMQFPGLYHPPPPPPQVSGMATHHHLGPAGSVNVQMASSASVAPGTQMSAYQQPQMSHLNWNNANF